MGDCAFCGRSPAPDFTVTACASDPQDGSSHWRREVLPVCPRCHRALAQAGPEGRTLKTTGERWWLGHGYGQIKSEGAPGVR
jgi:hypothetical protein